MSHSPACSCVETHRDLWDLFSVGSLRNNLKGALCYYMSEGFKRTEFFEKAIASSEPADTSF